MSVNDWGTISRPSREFVASVQYRVRGQGPVLRETISVRSDSATSAVRTLGIMAELRHGFHYVISELGESIGDIVHPVRWT